ncbi:hypothetical protein, conserved [Trypanosoma brucei gambiense DAL972]|uniref:C2H2-type domain-containing protein n=2 Tax=Trypanosoma brucei TaxID=5691 RepID=C9ZN48_TRYB9|nr:hypothetical protein, conserved [Trypanosoma brucei gambiense DAL972]RHW73105.1 hypothetical protein DPX39_040070100 [Trypanosoma brucei equiperdum]CBH10702.1 hypothetical protein, conserved [Trypanosoma brucei gambiense DAL972]|eukprot:XP_011772990.1 hypothetical protein, conserved [Trypanosoma brucei gambiense DAL972]
MASNSSAGKDEWLVGLQQFINTRLRTIPFAAAARVRPQVSVPLPLPNTQYLIDGLMWSVRDCAAWAADAWLCAQSHLHACTQRYAKLNETLTYNAQQRQGGRESKQGEDSAAERERMYDCHALIQDIYIAFCLVDAFLRHMSEVSKSVKELVEKELPRLVADHMPLWEPAHNHYAEEAVEDHRLLFLDLLRSWTVTGLLRPDTQRRIEEYVRHKLKTVREAIADSSRRSNDGQVAVSSRRERQIRAISSGLRAFLYNTAEQKQQQQLSVPLPSEGKSGERTNAVDAVRLTMASFVSAIFPSSRTEAGRYRCAHCGLVLKNASAKTSHYRYHFCSRSYNTELKIVRLPFPALEDYISHEVDCGETGSFVRVTHDMLDVFRSPQNRTVRVRERISREKPK